MRDSYGKETAPECKIVWAQKYRKFVTGEFFWLISINKSTNPFLIFETWHN
jgi:hypothetical protein